MRGEVLKSLRACREKNAIEIVNFHIELNQLHKENRFESVLMNSLLPSNC